MKKILIGLLLLTVAAFVRAGDHPEEAEENGAMPGAGHIMIEMGYRYSALYFAARQKRWDFAAYQLEEMDEALERLAHLKPEHQSNINRFRNAVVGDLEKALAAKSQDRFDTGFDKLRAECMACHIENGVGFIQLPVPQRHFSPVLE